MGRAGQFQWRVQTFGSNYRMTELQAAIGRVQLRKLPRWKESRNNFVKKIFEVANGYDIVDYFHTPDYMSPCYYRAYLTLNIQSNEVTKVRSNILRELIEKGVLCGEGACPEIYSEEAYLKSKFSLSHRHKNASYLSNRTIMFVVSPYFDEEITGQNM